MALIVTLLFVAVGTYAVYRLVLWSKMTGDRRGNAGALVIGLVMMFGVKAFLPLSPANDTRAKPSPPAKQTVTTVREEKTYAPNVSPLPSDSLKDSRMKNQVQNYLESLPGSQIVIVEGNSENGIRVNVDYNMGNVDRETAKNYAIELIYDILDANSDCPFKWIYVNCMNGKAPIGIIVHYEDGAFSTLP